MRMVILFIIIFLLVYTKIMIHYYILFQNYIKYKVLKL